MVRLSVAALRQYGAPVLRYSRLCGDAAVSGSAVQQRGVETSSIEHLSAFSSQLPVYPVPDLTKTLQKYRYVSAALLSPKERDTTEGALQRFENEDAPKLQEALLNFAQGKHNWLADLWFHHAYLDQRCPLPINVNPALNFPLVPMHSRADQINYAARLACAAAEFCAFVDGAGLGQEAYGGDMQCMHQYHHLFATCRLPRLRRDAMYLQPAAQRSSHVAVMYRGCFYDVDAVASVESMKEALGEIVAKGDSNSHQHSPHIGVLTCADRNTWATAYAALQADATSAQSLERVKTALFVLCLDQETANDNGRDCGELIASLERVKTALFVLCLDQETANDNGRDCGASQLLHGGGSKENSANRYFDKTLQLVVGATGASGITLEHGIAEGIVFAPLAAFCIDRLGKEGENAVGSSRTAAVRELRFNASAEVIRAIEKTTAEFDESVDNLIVIAHEFTDFGKSVPKRHKMSPDSFMQIGFQLAFHRIHGFPGVAYESGSLRRYKLGRTDTIRQPTVETVEFLKTIDNPSATPADKARALRSSIASHRKYVGEVMAGLGMDRHLLGLKKMVPANEQLPSLYDDVSYKRMNDFNLSTSQIAAVSDCRAFFGPMSEHCYAVCYNPQEDRFLHGMSVFRSNAREYNVERFAEELSRAYRDMRDVLDGAPEQSKL